MSLIIWLIGCNAAMDLALSLLSFLILLFLHLFNMSLTSTGGCEYPVAAFTLENYNSVIFSRSLWSNHNVCHCVHVIFFILRNKVGVYCWNWEVTSTSSTRKFPFQVWYLLHWLSILECKEWRMLTEYTFREKCFI